MAQAMPPQGAVMTAAPEVPYALMNRMKLLSSAVLVASVVSMLAGGFGVLTIGAVITSLLAYRSVTKAPNVKHLKWFSCWTFTCALFAIAGMIAAMAIGVPAVSCACDDECVDASWQLFDQIRTEANLSTSSLSVSATTQQSYEQWAGKTYNATVASAAALTDRISEQLQNQLHSLDPSEPGRMPPPPAQPPVVAEVEEPAPPAGPRPAIRKPKEPGVGAEIVPPSTSQRARFMSAGNDEDVKPADTESAKPPSTVDEQGNPLPEFQHHHRGHHGHHRDGHHGGMRGSHHVCKKAAAIRWMAPRLSGFMRRVAGHMHAMRAAHIMAAAREFEMMHGSNNNQELEQEDMPVGTAVVFASPADSEMDSAGAAAPDMNADRRAVHHSFALGRPGPLSLIRGFMHALMTPAPHEHHEHEHRHARQEKQEDREEQDEEPKAVWRVHRLPGMRRLLLEDEAVASKHRDQQKQEGGKPPAVYFSTSSSSGKSSHHADKRGKHHSGEKEKDKYYNDEEVSQSKLGAYDKQRLSDEQRERQEEIADEVLEDAPNDQALLVRFAAWGKTVTRLDFDKLAAKACGSGALVLTLGSILVSCFSVFLFVASSAAKKLSRHPYMVQQDALRRAARALAIQQRRGMGMGAIPVATPVAGPSGGANGGAPAADAMYRFVPGAGFVQVNADGSPVANAAPVPAGAGATVPATFGAPHPSGGMFRTLGTGVASTLRTGAEMFGTLFRPGANRGGYAPVGTVESAADDNNSSNQGMPATAPNGSSVEMTSFHHPGSSSNNGGNVATGGAVSYSSGGHAGAYAAYPQPMAPHAVPASHFQGQQQQHQQQPPMMMYGAPAAYIVQQPAPLGPPPGSAAAYTIAERR